MWEAIISFSVTHVKLLTMNEDRTDYRTFPMEFTNVDNNRNFVSQFNSSSGIFPSPEPRYERFEHNSVGNTRFDQTDPSDTVRMDLGSDLRWTDSRNNRVFSPICQERFSTGFDNVGSDRRNVITSTPFSGGTHQPKNIIKSSRKWKGFVTSWVVTVLIVSLIIM